MPEKIAPTFKSGKYGNPWSTWADPPTLKLAKWAFTKKNNPYLTRAQLDEKIPVVKTDLERIAAPPTSGIQVTWIGHSSSVIQMDGMTFLTDPVFQERASPLSFAGPKRIRPVPFELKDLPRVDFIVISHNHYDHLDITVVNYFARNRPETKWYVPKGEGKYFRDNGIKLFEELDWWESAKHNENITLTFTPAQHWSKRNMIGSFETLWGSWCVKGPSSNVFFGGDTGYCPVYKDIGHFLGPFDFSMIAIGAYQPRELMKAQHIDPEEAVQIHEDLNSKQSMGIHWGTFILTDEPEDEPPILLKQELAKKNIPEEQFITFKHGETKLFSSNQTQVENYNTTL